MATFKCKCHYCGKTLIRKTQAKEVRLHFCNNECKGEHQRTAKPVTREWLYDHYVTKGLDTTQIGHMVKRDPKSVWNWLKDFGIPTRPRGGDKTGGKGNPAHWFKKGHKLSAGRKLSEETKAKIRVAAIADGRVPYDPQVVPNGGRRGKDHPSWKGGITAERQAFYATPEWRLAAKQVVKRDKSTCQRCGKKKIPGDGFAFDIHHVVSFECVELRAVVSNLVYLCEPCHYWVHGKKNVNLDFIKEMPKCL